MMESGFSSCTEAFSPYLNSFSVDQVIKQIYDDKISIPHVIDTVVFILQDTHNTKTGYVQPRKIVTSKSLKDAFLYYHQNSTSYNLATTEQQDLMRRKFELLKIVRNAINSEEGERNELFEHLREEVLHKQKGLSFCNRAHVYDFCLKRFEKEKKKAEKEAAKKAEKAKKKAEEDAKKKAEEDNAKKKAEEDAKKKAEEDAKKKAEEDAKKKAEEDNAKKKAEEDAKKKAEEDAKKKAEEDDGKKKAEEDAKKKAEEYDAKKKAEKDAKKKERKNKKPRGRPPNGKVWDPITLTYVQSQLQLDPFLKNHTDTVDNVSFDEAAVDSDHAYHLKHFSSNVADDYVVNFNDTVQNAELVDDDSNKFSLFCSVCAKNSNYESGYCTQCNNTFRNSGICVGEKRGSPTSCRGRKKQKNKNDDVDQPYGKLLLYSNKFFQEEKKNPRHSEKEFNVHPTMEVLIYKWTDLQNLGLGSAKNTKWIEGVPNNYLNKEDTLKQNVMWLKTGDPSHRYENNVNPYRHMFVKTKDGLQKIIERRKTGKDFREFVQKV